jgi:hypothetical protein
MARPGQHETGGANPSITAWTLIVRAQGTGKEASAALGELLTRFRPFIVWYMAWLRPPPDQSSDDLYQQYVYQLLRSKAVEKLRKDGSFRGFLKASVRFFVLNEWTQWRKRQREPALAFDVFGGYAEADIDAAYLGNIVLQALALAASRSPNPERFAALQRFLPGPQCDFVAQAPLATTLGMTGVAIRGAILEERRRYELCLDEIVLSTLDLEDDALDPARVEVRVKEEKALLLAALEPAPDGLLLENQKEET